MQPIRPIFLFPVMFCTSCGLIPQQCKYPLTVARILEANASNISRYDEVKAFAAAGGECCKIRPLKTGNLLSKIFIAGERRPVAEITIRLQPLQPTMSHNQTENHRGYEVSATVNQCGSFLEKFEQFEI